MSRFAIFSSTLKKELAKPYAYGVADCFMLGCRMADALDPASRLVETYGGAYSTLVGAQRALRRRGFKTLADLLGKHLTLCAPSKALLGDLVIVDRDGGQHVAVCLGLPFVGKTERGRTEFELSECVAAFRTGAR